MGLIHKNYINIRIESKGTNSYELKHLQVFRRVHLDVIRFLCFVLAVADSVKHFCLESITVDSQP